VEIKITVDLSQTKKPKYYFNLEGALKVRDRDSPAINISDNLHLESSPRSLDILQGGS